MKCTDFMYSLVMYSLVNLVISYCYYSLVNLVNGQCGGLNMKCPQCVPDVCVFVFGVYFQL